MAQDGKSGRTQAAIVIRAAGPEDAEALAHLVRGLARYDGKDDVSHLTTEKISEWLCNPDPAFDALIAEVDGEAVGYAAFYPAFSLYRGGPLMLLENLFVTEQARQGGVGRRLVVAVAAEAERRGYGRLELTVRESNRKTRAFYERIGLWAPGELVYRTEDEALTLLAKEDEEDAGGG